MKKFTKKHSTKYVYQHSLLELNVKKEFLCSNIIKYNPEIVFIILYIYYLIKILINIHRKNKIIYIKRGKIHKTNLNILGN